MKVMNWMGSDILTKAVAKGVVTEIEAEVVIEVAVYERSFDYIACELSISSKIAKRLYQEAIPKLRQWIETSVIIMPKGRIICD